MALASENTKGNCVSCHKHQVNQWRQSDHAKAMSEATQSNVLGNFANVKLEHFGQRINFFKENSQYWVEIYHNGESTKHKIDYTFGHFPLQQYLVKAKDGRYQVLPYAWDSRRKSKGGQKWYPIYADEDIHQEDRLHWQQPLQNWNGMCADCHSDGLKRNYSVAQNSFDTTYDNINISCQSCHGKMLEHANAQSAFNISNSPLISSKGEKAKLGQWLRDLDEDTAHWQSSDSNTSPDKSTMNTCFACHSLRSPLTDGFSPNLNFLDQFSPSLLAAPLYHADGQIKEEVYVYGSFLQSKMYDAGVTCLDCHDSHSMKVKSDTNALCLQCHSPSKFDSETHHKHKKQSAGTQCVNCHMPTNRYMGVDDRRDHSFKIPRPDLSKKLGTPNACNQCHTTENPQWAENWLEKWFGSPKIDNKNYHYYLQLQAGKTITPAAHLAIVNDHNLPEIVRASALVLLPNSGVQLYDSIVEKWVESKFPLIRLALARVGFLLSHTDRQGHYASLLKDKYRAIRVAAANQLLDLDMAENQHFKMAFEELLQSNDLTSWRGEGHLNQSLVYSATQQTKKAISSLEKSIVVDPYFPGSYVNLADIYRNLSDGDNEKRVFAQALKAVPKSAILQYSYGMYLVRSKLYDDAIHSFEEALKLEPNNSQFAYIYIVALDSTNQTHLALRRLKSMMKYFNNNQQLIELGLGLSQKAADKRSFDYFMQFKK